MNRIDPNFVNIIINELPESNINNKSIWHLDTEFFGQDLERLHRPHGKFACLTATTNGRDVYLLDNEQRCADFLYRIKECVHVWHNAQYDIKQIRAFLDYPDRKNLWDTMLIEQILFRGYYDTFALNDLYRRYCNMYLPKEDRATFSTSTELSDEQMFYACCDVIALHDIYYEQIRQMDEDAQTIWNIEREFLWVLLDAPGWTFDSEKWKEQAIRNQKIADAINESLPFNPRSHTQVKAFFLNQYGLELDSTAEPVLEQLDFKKYPEAEQILDSRHGSNSASKYGLSFLEYVEEDGKIYPSARQIGAECLPKGELVLTNLGYLPVEDVTTDHWVISHTGKPRKVVDISYHKSNQIVKVTLSNGLSLRTTINHPYLTDGGWVEAGNLPIGTSVYIHSNPEYWKPIDGWENYSVSSWGRVYSNRSNKIITQQIKDRWGHLKVTLSRGKATKRGENLKDFNVHRLVANAFIPNQDNCKEVRHLDGIAWNNVVENLSWGSRKDNINDAIVQGRMSHRNTSQAKFNDEMVNIIRTSPYERGLDGKLATMWGVSREMVRDIRLGKRWQEDYFADKQEGSSAFYLANVVSVEYNFHENSYGLTVEEDGSHVTGGIVTHNTGRESYTNPPIQTIPGTKEKRECFIASEGCVQVVADYSAQEPRISAEITQDENFIETFKQGIDIYIAIGFEVFGEKFEKSDERRDFIKALFLAISYGMSAIGLAKKLGITEEEAEELLNKFFTKFPDVEKYIKAQNAVGEVCSTIYGRKFWLNHYNNQWFRNALNFPIQGSAADCTKLACSRIRKALGYNAIVGIIHDEIVFDIPEDDLERAKKIITDVMVGTAEEMHPSVPSSIGLYVGSGSQNNWSVKE